MLGCKLRSVGSKCEAGVVGFPTHVCSLNPDQHRPRHIFISVKWLQIFFNENFQNKTKNKMHFDIWDLTGELGSKTY